MLGKTLVSAAIIGGVLGRAVPAAAETTPVTSIHQLMILETGDKNYRLFHGAIWLDIDKATTNYRWGGAQCAGKDLTESSVQILFAAFRNEDAVSFLSLHQDYLRPENYWNGEVDRYILVGDGVALTSESGLIRRSPQVRLVDTTAAPVTVVAQS